MKIILIFLSTLIFSCTNRQDILFFEDRQIKFDNFKKLDSTRNDNLNIDKNWKEIFYIDGDCPKCLPNIMSFIETKDSYHDVINRYSFILILKTEDELGLSLRMHELLSDFIVFYDKNSAFLYNNDIEMLENNFSIVVDRRNHIKEIQKGFVSKKRRKYLLRQLEKYQLNENVINLYRL